MTPSLSAVELSRGAFGMLVRLFPGEFRRDFQAEVLQVFRDDCRDTYQTGGLRALLALWLRTLPEVLACAASEHLAAWMADHPAQHRGGRHQALITLALSLTVVAVFLIDTNTPSEVPMAVMYSCVLFAAGALLPPSRSLLICAAMLGVYVVDGWIAPSGWTVMRGFGLAALLTAGIWALRTGADHARLKARNAGDASRPAGARSLPSELGQREAALEMMQSLALRGSSLTKRDLVNALRAGVQQLESRRD